jgi:very-short-patch-repair endonuclease
MRHTPVATEKLFWSRIRDRKLGGFKFKRQFLIDPFIVDYVCLEKMLIVELDGDLHDNTIDYDEARDAFLRRKGYRVLRFMNGEVTEDIGRVLETILQALKAPSP